MSEERAVPARLATPGRGIEAIEFPLAHVVSGLNDPRRIVLSLLARSSNREDLRDIAKRLIRFNKRGAIPNPTVEDRDNPCEPLDLVMIVAGLIWPGLEVWRKAKKDAANTLLMDFWWGFDGKFPGAAILRDGVLHLVHLDRDTEYMLSTGWNIWLKENWQGPVIHHAIQVTGEDPSDQRSPILGYLGNQPRSKRGAVIWGSSAGLDLRPFRVDFGNGKAFLMPLSEGFRVATLPGIHFPLRVEMSTMAVFQRWVEELVVPENLRVAPPSFSVIAVPKGVKRSWGGHGESVRSQKAPEQTPLFPEECEVSETESPLLVSVFGEGISSKTDPARIESMLTTAKEGLMRASAAMQPGKADHWRSVLREIESANNKTPQPHPYNPAVAP